MLFSGVVVLWYFWISIGIGIRQVLVELRGQIYQENLHFDNG